MIWSRPDRLAFSDIADSPKGFSMARARIGLMGFGRIGRNVFRMVQDHPELEIAAIADISDPAGLTYLLKYDSIYGRFPVPVEHTDGALFLDGRRIPFLAAKEPGDADWAELGVDIVVQATGSYRTSEWCQKHIDAGARNVILASTPDTPGDIPILLKGTNDEILDDDPNIVSLGSNTSNALAPDPPHPRCVIRLEEGLLHRRACNDELPATGRRADRRVSTEQGGRREHHPGRDQLW